MPFASTHLFILFIIDVAKELDTVFFSFVDYLNVAEENISLNLEAVTRWSAGRSLPIDLQKCYPLTQRDPAASRLPLYLAEVRNQKASSHTSYSHPCF